VILVIEPPNRIFEAVKVAVKLGSDVNAVDPVGDTALHKRRRTETMRRSSSSPIMERNSNAKNDRGQTPVTLALTAGGSRAAASANADADVTGITVVVRGHPSTVELLRKLGATQ
jgi:ankyrin repeat protein